ncbi:hypothetical protein OpiT1DRAFT_03388 [Opitutaceae bacterium TAV1]|nr:hypothetical protein OpiT1DRAFT_03388 [Opitutaceae bacterium TAV1]
MSGMARNDTMRESLYAPVLLEVEAALNETRHLAREQKPAFNDTAVRSVLPHASTEAYGKPAKIATVSPGDWLLANVVARLLMVEDGKAAAEAGSEPDSRGCLDFIAGFLRDAAEQTYPMRT